MNRRRWRKNVGKRGGGVEIWGVEGDRVLRRSRRRRRRSRNMGSRRGQIMQGQKCRWAAAVQGEQTLE